MEERDFQEAIYKKDVSIQILRQTIASIDPVEILLTYGILFLVRVFFGRLTEKANRGAKEKLSITNPNFDTD